MPNKKIRNKGDAHNHHKLLSRGFQPADARLHALLSCAASKTGRRANSGHKFAPLINEHYRRVLGARLIALSTGAFLLAKSASATCTTIFRNAAIAALKGYGGFTPALKRGAWNFHHAFPRGASHIPIFARGQ